MKRDTPIARLPTRDAESPALALTVALPPAGLDALRAIVREECAEAVAAQSAPPRLLTDEEICRQVLRTTSRTLRMRLLQRGIPFVLVGDQRRWDPDEVIEWLRQQRQGIGE
jgi:hypothetical protein